MQDSLGYCEECGENQLGITKKSKEAWFDYVDVIWKSH